MRSRWAAAALAFAVSACSTRAVDVGSPVPLPDAFSRSGDTALPALWWTAFDDDELDLLVEEALGSNFSL